MLYEPTNIIPSTLTNTGVVDVTDDVYFQWQINGNSIMTGFTINIYLASTDDTTTAVTAVKTETVTGLTVYGRDKLGNITPYKYQPEVTWESWGLTNGNEYKFNITQTYSGGATEQISYTAFFTRTKPIVQNLTISNLGTANSILSQSILEATATYYQEQGDNIENVRWKLYEGSATDGTLLDDTGEIQTALLAYDYAGCQNNKQYTLTCQVTSEKGQESEIASISFTVTYTSSSYDPNFSAKCSCDSDSINLAWDLLPITSIDIIGTAAPADGYSIDSGVLSLTDSATITWDKTQVKGEEEQAMNFSAPYTLIWKCDYTLPDATTAMDVYSLKTSATNINGVSISYNDDETLLVLTFLNNIVQNSTSNQVPIFTISNGTYETLDTLEVDVPSPSACLSHDGSILIVTDNDAYDDNDLYMPRIYTISNGSVTTTETATGSVTTDDETKATFIYPTGLGRSQQTSKYAFSPDDKFFAYYAVDVGDDTTYYSIFPFSVTTSDEKPTFTYLNKYIITSGGSKIDGHGIADFAFCKANDTDYIAVATTEYIDSYYQNFCAIYTFNLESGTKNSTAINWVALKQDNDTSYEGATAKVKFDTNSSKLWVQCGNYFAVLSIDTNGNFTVEKVYHIPAFGQLTPSSWDIDTVNKSIACMYQSMISTLRTFIYYDTGDGKTDTGVAFVNEHVFTHTLTEYYLPNLVAYAPQTKSVCVSGYGVVSNYETFCQIVATEDIPTFSVGISDTLTISYDYPYFVLKNGENVVGELAIDANSKTAILAVTGANFYAYYFDTDNVLRAERTESIEYTQEAVTSVVLSGTQVCDYVALLNGTWVGVETLADPETAIQWVSDDYTVDMYASFYDGTLNAGTAASDRGFIVYRQEGNNTAQEYITLSPDVSQFQDYGVKSNTQYTYSFFAYDLNDAFIGGVSKTITSRRFQRYTLLSTTYSEDDGCYHVVKEYKFAYNISNMSVSNNSNPSFEQNFTPYPTMFYSSANYRSGTLQALIGTVDKTSCQYTDTATLMNELNALSTSDTTLFLKDMKGNICMVAISGAITQTAEQKTPQMEVTISVPWTEIGNADEVSIVMLPSDTAEVNE